MIQGGPQKYSRVWSDVHTSTSRPDLLSSTPTCTIRRWVSEQFNLRHCGTIAPHCPYAATRSYLIRSFHPAFSDFWSIITITAEFTRSGGVLMGYEYDTVRLYTYFEAPSTFWRAWEFTVILFFVYYAVVEVVKGCRKGWSHFASVSDVLLPHRQRLLAPHMIVLHSHRYQFYWKTLTSLFTWQYGLSALQLGLRHPGQKRLWLTPMFISTTNYQQLYEQCPSSSTPSTPSSAG